MKKFNGWNMFVKKRLGSMNEMPSQERMKELESEYNKLSKEEKHKLKVEAEFEYQLRIFIKDERENTPKTRKHKKKN